MINDRILNLLTCSSRMQTPLKEAPLRWSDLVARLGHSETITQNHADYVALPKAQQDELKDRGGFLAGTSKDGHRRAGCVLSRSCVTLDMDSLPDKDAMVTALKRLDALGAAYCVYSTAKHHPAKPRLRVVIPLNKDIEAELFPLVTILTAKLIQPELTWFDPTCDQPQRIMFFPTHCQDVAPVYHAGDNPFLNGMALIERDCPGWQDVTTWPSFPGAEKKVQREQKRQQDPTEKDGIVGAFCRVYDVPGAMAAFLPGVYEEAGEGRYTFVAGSTAGGALLYEDGKFLYSYHATDPASGQLVNSWDLVRLHKFGDLDDSAAPGLRGNTLPSFQAMADFARQDPDVINQIARDTFSTVSAAAGAETKDQDAGVELAKHQGDPLSERVLDLALQAWGVTARVNDITGRGEVEGLPPQYLRAAAINVLPTFLSDVLKPMGIKGASPTAIAEYMQLILAKSHYNPVVEMLDGTVWDGVDRLPILLDILGVDHEGLSATLVRKWLIQGVALARNTYGSGYGADGVLTLQGSQGIGKTLFFRRVAVKPDWYAEGVVLDFRNKDSQIQATAAWITELGELDETLRKEQSWLKGFITSAEDRIRAPYARAAEPRPRRTSFCATVNPDGFLWDTSGNRRFWTVPVERIDLEQLKSLPEAWFIQLWAEVNVWWAADPQGFRLTREEMALLAAVNEEHRRTLVGEEEIMELLDFSLPADQWEEFTASEILRMGRFDLLNGLNAAKVGKALQSIARRVEGVTFRTLDGRKLYRLPRRRSVAIVPGVEPGGREVKGSGANSI